MTQGDSLTDVLGGAGATASCGISSRWIPFKYIKPAVSETSGMRRFARAVLRRFERSAWQRGFFRKRRLLEASLNGLKLQGRRSLAGSNRRRHHEEPTPWNFLELLNGAAIQA